MCLRAEHFVMGLHCSAGDWPCTGEWHTKVAPRTASSPRCRLPLAPPERAAHSRHHSPWASEEPLPCTPHCIARLLRYGSYGISQSIPRALGWLPGECHWDCPSEVFVSACMLTNLSAPPSDSHGTHVCLFSAQAQHKSSVRCLVMQKL